MPTYKELAARLAVAAMMACLPHHATAQDKLDCATATATFELNACSEIELDKADAQLNSIYKKLLAKIATSDGEKPYDAKSWEAALRASQRAWVAFRDADCKGLVALAAGGGTATTGEILGCMTEKTIRRTDELTTYYEAN